MDTYFVLGNPIEHSKSPWIHRRFAELTGQPIRYERKLVPLDGFAATVAALRAEGVRGCNVTVPFKFEAAALATGRSERVELAGACNTLCFDGDRILADNTDGTGLVNDIERNAGIALAGQALLLAGAGGAGAGVLGPLLAARPARIVVSNRSVDKAEALVAAHAAIAQRHGVQLSACGLRDAPGAFDVIVNATATSLAGGPVPVPDTAVRSGALVYDMMYGPQAQGFLDWAAALGAQPRDGLGMLVEQAAESFRIWRGIRPPSGQVLDELRASLAA